MDETRLADVIASAYGAASGGNTWVELGASLRNLLGAQRSSLRVMNGSLTNLLGPVDDEADAAYLAHYYRVDPYRNHAITAREPPPTNTATLGSAIVASSELHRTEYFNDYAVRYGQHHMLGGNVGLQKVLPIGLHRDAAAGAFTAEECRILERILPHLQRALQLRERLAFDPHVSNISIAALDALSACVIVTDGTMRMVHINQGATEITSPGRSGLMISRVAGGDLHLSARHRDDNAALQRLVALAASGGAGGAMRVRAQWDDVPEEAALAVLVSPLAAHLVASETGLVTGMAMVVARELTKSRTVPERLLNDLYGLTSAEASVAAALAGGIKAEDVARARRVSLDTVRAQVRTVLRKTNAANLRDFERIIALISAA